MLSRRDALKYGFFGAVSLPFLSELLAACTPPPPTPSAKWSQQGYGANPVVDKPILLDVDANVSSLRITPQGVLVFDTNASRALHSSGNVVVEGKLSMRPADASKVHLLQFTGVNESAMVGGGLDPIASDVGLWCMGAGLLDLVGTTKTPWRRANAAMNAGSTSLPVSVSGWNAGDEVGIASTSLDPQGGEVRTLSSSSSLTSPLSNSHPMSPARGDGSRLGAEVLNLTRNVRIEGTPGHRAHMFIRSTSAQNLSCVQFRWMGPEPGGRGVLGRYPVHFHHCMDGSAGSQLFGCVVRDCGNHGYVSHMSNSITYTSCTTQDTTGIAWFWDDDRTTSSGITYNGCGTNHCGWNLDFDYTHDGFNFGLGPDGSNSAHDCFVAGVYGKSGSGTGFRWEANTESVWSPWTNNVAHSCDIGISVWQNDDLPHVIDRPLVWSCAQGVGLGAYANSYTVSNGEILNCPDPIHVIAVANSGPQVWKNLRVDCMGTSAMRFSDGRPAGEFNDTLVQNCTFFNAGSAPVLRMEVAEGQAGHINTVKVTGCTFPPGAVKAAKDPGCYSGSSITVS